MGRKHSHTPKHWGLRFKRALFKRIAGLREVKMAWHNTYSLKPNLPQNPPPCTAPEYCCSREHHIASETHSSQLYTPCSTMPCAAGSLCIAKPDHTLGPSLFTNHKCRVCGTYLHGMCGLPDPEGDDEMRRVCRGCVNSNNRKNSNTDPEH